MNENFTQNSYDTNTNRQDNEYKTYAPNNYNGPIIVTNAAPKKTGGLAAGSLACGIIGLISFWFVLASAAISITGLTLGIVNLASKNPHHGIAIAGVITSVLALLLSIATCIIFIITSAMVV